jgi:hypothetical protein
MQRVKRSIALLALIASGCTAATQASRPEWPPSYKFCGGVLADAALSGAANAIQANTRGPENTRDNYFLPIFGTLLISDIALTLSLYYLQQR